MTSALELRQSASSKHLTTVMYRFGASSHSPPRQNHSIRHGHELRTLSRSAFLAERLPVSVTFRSRVAAFEPTEERRGVLPACGAHLSYAGKAIARDGGVGSDSAKTSVSSMTMHDEISREFEFSRVSQVESHPCCSTP